MKIKWLMEAKESNIAAAESYLILTCGHEESQRFVKKLKKANVESFAAKDILRAAEMKALPEDTEHVKKNMEKMKAGMDIGPVLLCRVKDRPLIIADGLHRVSAAWHIAEDTIVEALVVDD
jgi:hypothetical protein